MKTQQLTDWFPGDVKPVRSGVYEVERPAPLYRWFSVSSGFWYSGSTSPVVAKDIYNDGRGPAVLFQIPRRWRGLRAKP